MKSRISGRISVHCLLVLLAALVISSTTFAQTGTSSVTGTVTDPQGNVVAGATVVLANPAKNFTRTQTSNENGAYSFTSIPPDTYTVEVTAAGFQKARRTGVQVNIQQQTVVEMLLPVHLGAVDRGLVAVDRHGEPVRQADTRLPSAMQSNAASHRRGERSVDPATH